VNIFDACNVKQLLAGYLLSALGKDCPERTAELLALEAAIREHVIREASVGRVSIKYVVAVGNFVDDEHVTFSKRPQDRHWIDYDLIPKETP